MASGGVFIYLASISLSFGSILGKISSDWYLQASHWVCVRHNLSVCCIFLAFRSLLSSFSEHHGREYMLLTYISLLMLCAASCFLFVFCRIRCEWKFSTIHYLSQCVLSVYLIHLHPVFSKYIMLRLGVFIANFHIVVIPVLLILSAALIFVVCLVIELIRRFVQNLIRGYLT